MILSRTNWILSIMLIVVTGHTSGMDNQEIPKCVVCLDEFDHESIIIQTDCPVGTHAYHLGCIHEYVRARRNLNQQENCPTCNSQLTIHDPCAVAHNYGRLHTNQALKNEDRQKLEELFVRYRIARSDKPRPLPVLRHCGPCGQDLPDDAAYIQFSCHHGGCLDHASELITAGQHCPQCNEEIREISDPVRFNNDGTVILHQTGNPITAAQRITLNRLRQHVQLTQNQYPNHQRVPLEIRNTTKMCTICHIALGANDFALRFSCNHKICLVDAMVLANSYARHCPTCNAQLRLIDPIRFTHYNDGTIEIINGPENAPPDLIRDLLAIRQRLPIRQELIPAVQRIPTYYFGAIIPVDAQPPEINQASPIANYIILAAITALVVYNFTKSQKKNEKKRSFKRQPLGTIAKS